MKLIVVGNLCNGLYVYRPNSLVVFYAQSIPNSLKYHINPHDVWVDLSSCFCHDNNAQIYLFKCALFSLQQTMN